MSWPEEGWLLRYWMRHFLLRSLRRVRSRSRLYEALAERETDEASQELYLRLANNERGRAARKLGSLFRMRARLPVDRDSLVARAWRHLLISCGPRVAMRWVEWSESREQTLIIAAARAGTRLTRL
jgi:hypothetical protein